MIEDAAAESILHCCAGQGKLQIQWKRFRMEKLCAGGSAVTVLGLAHSQVRVHSLDCFFSSVISHMMHKKALVLLF